MEFRYLLFYYVYFMVNFKLTCHKYASKDLDKPSGCILETRLPFLRLIIIPTLIALREGSRALFPLIILFRKSHIVTLLAIEQLAFEII